MAGTSSQNRSGHNNNNRKSGSASRNNSQSRQPGKRALEQKRKDQLEIIAILLMAFAVFLTLCNLGVAGSFGRALKHFMFGIFGVLAYVIPILLALGFLVYLANKGNRRVVHKAIQITVLLYALSMMIELFGVDLDTVTSNWFTDLYNMSADEYRGGGLLAGMLTLLLYNNLSKAGTMLVIIVIMLICIVFLTEKSIVNMLKKGSERAYDSAVRGAERHKKRKDIEEDYEGDYEEEEPVRHASSYRAKTESVEADKQEESKPQRRVDKKFTGVSQDTLLVNEVAKKKEPYGENLHEIRLEDLDDTETVSKSNAVTDHFAQPSGMKIKEDDFVPTAKTEAVKHSVFDTSMIPEPKGMVESTPQKPSEIASLPDPDRSDLHSDSVKRERVHVAVPETESKAVDSMDNIQTTGKRSVDKYKLPTVNLLKPATNSNSGDTSAELKETAAKLVQTLEIFGVKAKITDISKGPSVTRFELQPELGVKVSKIVGLADDIKLQLAATDIRIEAPIPGKSAVGIEVPNKAKTSVSFRELLESREYKNSSSKISFAVGKDLGGQIVVWDIAKMPHVLIAGTTGSGKSVCMNTLIMSILYKANPEEVKFIMVDPKRVEFSMYKGIPHLLLPVVTDPKQAAGALNWGVEEMTRRYQLFADINVKDIGSYNSKVADMAQRGEQAPAKLPQIVIVVDELADLMMVAQQSVEASICRLAQLARAAGIHLVIATQRPSVDVVTGLIKANMPSRIACKLSSGVDSRTILDMGGAEKLLGNGDMLFFPNGAAKPMRVQGAYLSEDEIESVVDFIKSQDIIVSSQEDLMSKIRAVGEGGGAANSGGAGAAEDEYDSFFVDAGRLIIEKDKASIGMLQRAFKIGFNRAARIMDQLCDAGVVSEEESTKPRNVLMSLEQFENFVEQNL